MHWTIYSGVAASCDSMYVHRAVKTGSDVGKTQRILSAVFVAVLSRTEESCLQEERPIVT